MCGIQGREVRPRCILYACFLVSLSVGSVYRLQAQEAQPEAQPVSSAKLERLAQKLRPGQSVWTPAISPSGPVEIHIDLSRQILAVYRDGVLIGLSTISSGRPGYGTPTGVFTILQKDIKHRSNKYYNAPMPYTQRFTEDGAALHAGGVPGYPESHGCVHLPFGFARQLFGVTSIGETVIVEGKAGRRAKAAKAASALPMEWIVPAARQRRLLTSSS